MRDRQGLYNIFRAGGISQVLRIPLVYSALTEPERGSKPVPDRQGLVPREFKEHGRYVRFACLIV